MQKSISRLLLSCFAVLMMINGCHAKKNEMAVEAPDAAPDYDQPFSWVNRPDTLRHPVDVFYVYPTIHVAEHPVNMDISDLQLRKNAKGLIQAQAGVYAPHANLFAPFYRQQTAACQSMKAGNGGKDAFQDPVFLVGAGDVERAFDYYLTHLNTDRPFLLAGHSQGTMTLIHLMRRRFHEFDLQKRLVAAYLIGYSVTNTDLEKYPWMKPAQGETDTGIIVTFNTEGEKAGPSPVLLPGAVAINPLNWRTDNTPAGPSLNMGARFFNDATGDLIEEINHFAGARLDLAKGVLVATQTKTPQSHKINLVDMGRWPKGVFHRFDYAFWFNNIKANVGQRVAAYQAHNR